VDSESPGIDLDASPSRRVERIHNIVVLVDVRLD
jgi:hypothetical protein